MRDTRKVTDTQAGSAHAGLHAVQRVDIVPHTHWDREWYAPFQTFRARLVELLDELLDLLDGDPSFAHFLLDGQMAVIDDYLEIRPHEGARIGRLCATGRIAMGPWYTLPDEFLVSGETLVRDLQLGMWRAGELGGAMHVGYLPDMFGHVAQMPQLLRLFGFAHAVVWRGVPSTIDRTGFWWSAPDGSTVRAEYLPSGYGNGAAMPPDVDRFRARIDAWIDEHRKLLDGAPALWMNGSDHRTAQPELPLLIDAVNDDAAGALSLRITSLAQHLADAPVEGLPSWSGELRSGAHANLLMGVASNRVDVKQAAARAERALEQEAEPLAAMLLAPEEWPAALLDHAWREMIRNAAHDSICACSADEVVDTVLHRYAEARQIAEAVVEQATRRLADHLEHHGSVVVNPSPRRRSGLVTVRFPGSDGWRGTQPLGSEPAEHEAFDLPREQALAVLPELVGWTDELTGVTFVDGFERLDVILHCDGSTGDLAPNRSAVAAALESRPRHASAPSSAAPRPTTRWCT